MLESNDVLCFVANQEDLLKQHGGRMKMPWHLFFDGAIYVRNLLHWLRRGCVF